jgi:hypothetical protein
MIQLSPHTRKYPIQLPQVSNLKLILGYRNLSQIQLTSNILISQRPLSYHPPCNIGEPSSHALSPKNLSALVDAYRRHQSVTYIYQKTRDQKRNETLFDILTVPRHNHMPLVLT